MVGMINMPLPSYPYAGDRNCTKAEILDTLKYWMTVMQMKPGEKISDTEIAEYFNVSRTPVREVLKILEQQKLIHTYPGRATVVAELDTQGVESYYLPMQTLQCLAVRLAVDNATSEDIDELTSINEDFRNKLSDGKDTAGLLAADKAFHQKIIDIAGNEYVDEFCSALWVHIARLDYLFFKDSTEDSSYRDHEVIISSLRLKDPFGAELAMKNNWNNSMLAVKAVSEKLKADAEAQ